MRHRTKPRQHILAAAMDTLANNVAEASPCNRAAVGCVLTTLDLQVISYGYNGPASGLANECMRPNEPGNCGCVHAEQNAIAKAGSPEVPKVAFITMPPCERCASLLVNAGVVMVVYSGTGHRPMNEGIENVLGPLKIPAVSFEDGVTGAFSTLLGHVRSKIATRIAR